MARRRDDARATSKGGRRLRRRRSAPVRKPAGARAGRRRAVFVDRDGTLVREVGYLARVRDLRLLPGAAEGIRRLRAAGFAVVVVTNQSGIARGRLDVATLAAIHETLAQRLAACGTRVDAIYVCPHHPGVGRPPWRRRCRCRKPAPGLVRRAARALGIDLASSYCVGDSTVDLGLAAATGTRGVLVLTGHGRATARALDPALAGVRIAVNFRAAANWIIDDAGRRPPSRR